jgi:hypothetical protein
MHWLLYFLASLPAAATGLVCGGFIGTKCVRWYRISSFEGGSGYFVIFMALLGSVAGLVIGLVTAGIMKPEGAAAHWGMAGLAAGAVLSVTAVIVMVCRLRAADVPPRLDGRELMLVAEIKLPAGMAPPTAGESTDRELTLHSVVRRTARQSQSGKWLPEQARQEDGRWIVPGSAFLFTGRGQRSLSVRLHGENLIGYLVPLPARPGRKFLEWSEWGPRPRPPHPPWPESKPCYRFRIQPVAQS